MAINFEYPLTNSEGMEKVISFSDYALLTAMHAMK